MRSELVQTQEQKLIQQQRLTQQQMLQVRLLEMPLAELEQNVQMEIDDNPALETTPPEDDSFSTNEESTDSSESVRGIIGTRGAGRCARYCVAEHGKR